MAARYEIITFDCYGTLIDWERGIVEAFRKAAAEDGVTVEEDQLLAAYVPAEASVEKEQYRPYRDVLRESAVRAALAFGWTVAPEQASFLAESLPTWQPFPDTNPALERLREAGFALGILSNVDDDLLAATRRHFTVDFDLIITAEQVSSYKPAPAHFTAARQRIDGRRWLHAAQSNFHDIVPANALGIPTAWINRKNSAALPGGTPALHFRDLGELADELT